MPEDKVASCLNDWYVKLSQSVNIEYLALVNENGEMQASVGEFSPIDQDDAESILKSYFTKPENMSVPENVSAIHIIRQGAVECFFTPINGLVQLLAISSIERPSVLIRIMLNEIFAARDELTEIIKKEWKTSEKKVSKPIEVEKQMPDTIKPSDNEDSKNKTSLEDLITSSGGGLKIKEASKYWDSATMDEQQAAGNEKTISFNEAKRSGLVPDEKK